MALWTARPAAAREALPPLLTVVSRRHGLRGSWWENIRRLLRGQAIRRDPPERMALDLATRELLAKARAHGAVEVRDLALGLAVEGYGARRAVTVILAGRPVADGAGRPVADWAGRPVPDGGRRG